MEQRVIQTFHNGIELSMHAVEALAPSIVVASRLMVETLVGEQKIVVAGNGACGALGQIFVGALINCLHYERPSLPALSLNTDTNTLTAIVSDAGAIEIFAKQVRAIGQRGDLFLAISGQEDNSNIVKAIQAAHERDMRVVILSINHRPMAEHLSDNDVALLIPSTSLSSQYQVQLTTLLSLAELIDYQLFGVGD